MKPKTTALLGPMDPRHGTENGYGNLGCRCSECREAHRAYTASRRAALPPLAADDPRHGRRNTYQNYHCRCDACRTAAGYRKANRRSRPGGDA